MTRSLQLVAEILATEIGQQVSRLLQTTPTAPRPPRPRTPVYRREIVAARVLPQFVKVNERVQLVGHGVEPVGRAILVDQLVSVSLGQQSVTFDAGDLVEVETWE